MAFGYFTREHFPESRSLAEFVASEIPSVHFEESDLTQEGWIARLQTLLAMRPVARSEPNGATHAAAFLKDLLV